jgi:PAS domain S-box-containing protein
MNPPDHHSPGHARAPKKADLLGPSASHLGELAGFHVREVAIRGACTALWRATRDIDQLPVFIRAPLERGTSASSARKYLEAEYEIARRLPPSAVVIPIAQMTNHEPPFLVLPDPGGRFACELDHLHRDRLAWLRFAIQTAHALALVHDHGTIHKEIRPENLVVGDDGVKLTGLGFASPVPQQMLSEPTAFRLSESGIAYVSPEQTGRTRRGLDQRSDLYSLGVVLYELLTGELPLTGSDVIDWTHAHIARAPRPPSQLDPQIPEPLSEIVMKLLAKLPEERYQTARGLQRDLERCSAELAASGDVAGFALGQRDVPEQLVIAPRLYGRDAEVAALLGAFERAMAGPRPHVMLVSGYSGIGKTSVVRTLSEPVRAAGGFFLTGKFAQFTRGQPYATLAHALGELVRELLTQPDEQLARWRQEIARALGDIGRVIIEVVPKVELIIGPQPPIPELAAAQAENRLNHAFSSFIRVFAHRDHPICLFLDDLQSADAATLKLLYRLTTLEHAGGLLMLLAYRDNEVPPEHPFADFVDRLRSTGVPIDEVVLGPLAVSHVAELIAATLRRPRAECDAIARVVVARTLGNPFFVQEFLNALTRDELLVFDRGAGRWSWDEALVEAEAPTENVVALLARNLRTIAPGARAVLELASCFGNEFDFDTLSIISDHPEGLREDTLWALLGRGFILPAAGVEPGRKRYRFRHDRIQQAAYTLVPEEQRRALHLRIGRLLLASLPAEEQRERLVEIVEQIDFGVDQINDPTERAQVVALNVAAAAKSKAVSDHRSALRFLQSASKLLPDDPWQAQYSATLTLYCQKAECLFLVGQEEVADAVFQTILDHTTTRWDVAAVNTLRVRLYAGVSRYDDAIAAGFQALRLFGVEFPETDAEIVPLVHEERRRLQDLLGPRGLEDMLTAPVMTDPDALAIMGLLGALPPAIYPRRPALFPVLAIRMLEYSVRSGNTADSCFAYSMYAMLQVSVFGDIPGGHALSQMSIELDERLADRRHRCTVLHVHANHINYWREPYKNNVRFLDRALTATLEAGDSAIASHLSYQASWQVLERGLPLAETRQQIERYAALARQVRNDAAYQMILLQLAWTNELAGEGGANHAQAADERAALATFERTGSDTGRFFHHVLRAMSAFQAGAAGAAWRSAKIASRYLGGALALPIETTFAMYRALSAAAVLDGEPADREELLATLNADADKLRNWATHSPDNFAHKHHLVEAARAELAGDLGAAIRRYEEAIEAARDHGLAQDAALGNALAARCADRAGLSRIARGYRAEAWTLYKQLGALGCAARLERADPAVRVRAAGALAGSTFDVASVQRALQAISEKIEVPELLEALMRTVLQHAGADRGSLLRIRGDELVVEVTARIDRGQTLVALGTEQGAAQVPSTIVSFVRRTRDVVLIDDLLEDRVFAADPHFARSGVRSVLCVPIIKQGLLIGALYLENTILSGAFTPDKLAVVEMLSSQAAISLENAELYKEVRVQREWLRLTLSSIGEGVIACDPRARVIFVNPTAVTLTGWKAEDALGRPIDEVLRIVDEETYEPAVEIAQQLHGGGHLVAFGDHAALITREGCVVPIEVYAAPMADGAAELGEAVVVFRDVTEQRRAQEELRESEARLKILANAIPQLTWAARADGFIDWYNERWYQYTGTTPEQMAGWGWQTVHDPAVLPRVLARWRASLDEGTPFEMEFPLRGADDRFRRFLTRVVPLKDSEGHVVQWFGTSTDVTELSEAKEALADADCRKSDFLGVLSHELRNPLTPIRNSLYVLEKRASVDECTRRAAEVISRQVEHMARLIDELLDVTRIARGKIVLQPALLDLATVVRSASEDLGSTFQAAGVELALCVPERPVPVDADLVRLTQVFGNLLQNAAKFTPRGGRVTVSLRAVPETGTAVVEVTDTGVGLDRDMLAHVFEPFAQSDRSLDRSKGGLGLGLALVKGIVELHGGTASVASGGPGHGATFTITLPLDARSTAAQPAAAEPPVAEPLALRVLLIEDNCDIADTLREAVETMGHDASVAYDGASGLEQARKSRPDVVLCDVGLPGMSGYDVARAFRADPELRAVHLVAVTGYAGLEARREAEAAGFERHVAKPMNLSTIEAVLSAFARTPGP